MQKKPTIELSKEQKTRIEERERKEFLEKKAKVEEALNKFINQIAVDYELVIRPVYREYFMEGPLTRIGEMSLFKAMPEEIEKAKKYLSGDKEELTTNNK